MKGYLLVLVIEMRFLLLGFIADMSCSIGMFKGKVACAWGRYSTFDGWNFMVVFPLSGLVCNGFWND